VPERGDHIGAGIEGQVHMSVDQARQQAGARAQVDPLRRRRRFGTGGVHIDDAPVFHQHRPAPDRTLTVEDPPCPHRQH